MRIMTVVIIAALLKAGSSFAMDLKGLTELVLTNSKLMQAYQYRIQSDRHAFQRDQGQTLPSFTVPVSAGYDTTVGGWQFSPGVNAYLDLQKILTAYPAASELRVKRSRIEGKMAKADLEKETALAYYRLFVLTQTRSEDTNMKTYLDDHLLNIQKMADRGVDLKLDILRVKNQRAALLLSMDNTEMETENILAALSSLAGTNLVIQDFNFQDMPVLGDEITILSNYEENTAISADRTYQSALDRIDLEISEKSADQNRLYWLPVLQFYSGVQITNVGAPDYKFGVALEFPVFDFGARENQLQTAINDYQSQQSLYKEKQRKLSLYLQQLVENTERSFKIYTASLENLDNAKKSLNQASLLYQKGKISETDLLSVTLEWSNSKKQLFESLYDYLSGRAEIFYYYHSEGQQ